MRKTLNEKFILNTPVQINSGHCFDMHSSLRAINSSQILSVIAHRSCCCVYLMLTKPVQVHFRHALQPQGYEHRNSSPVGQFLSVCLPAAANTTGRHYTQVNL